MPFAPVYSLTVLVAGLLLLLIVASVPRLRLYARFLVPAVAGLSLLGVLATALEPPRPIPLSLWRPSVFFGTFPILQADPAMWSLAVAVACALTAAALVQLSRHAQPHFLVSVSALGLVAAALGSLWGANLLTTLVFWGWFDLAWVLGMVAVGASPRRIALGGSAALLATVALWAGALMVGTEGSTLSWTPTVPSGLGRDLLVVAGVLRLGLYPLHLALPVGISKSAPGAAPLFLGPVLGWGLLLRLTAAEGVVLADVGWLSWLGMATLVAGGLLAWSRSGTSEVLPWAALASAGATLWGAAVAGDDAPLVLAGGGAAWVLGVTLVTLGRGLARSAPWWTGGPLLGGLALLGTFLTPGAFVTSAVMRDVTASSTVHGALAFFFGQGLLTAGLARRILRPVAKKERAKPLETAARAAGLALPVLVLLLGGLHPPLLLLGLEAPSLGRLLLGTGALAWGLWLLAAGGGAALSRLESRFRKRAEPALSLLFDLVCLDWLLHMLLGGLGRAAQLLREIAELVEGAGAVLWALAIFLLVTLALVGH